MYQQTVDVVKDDALTIGGATKTYELETAGILSYIDLLVEATTHTTGANFVYYIPHYITGLEVIGNSTEILLSLDAQELAALNFYMSKQPVTERRTGEVSTVNNFHIPIPFGRFLDDPNYALDLEKWDLVELNITNADMGATSFFASGSYTVREKFIREGPAPTGYFKTYEANSWTPASATAEKTVDFPKDYLIRQALISVLPTKPAVTAYYEKEMWEILDLIKFTYKSGNIVVFDEDTEELMRQNEDDYGLVDLGGVVQGDADDYFSTDLGWVIDANVSAGALVGGTTSWAIAGVSNIPESRLKIFESNLADGQPINWTARGYAYMLSAIFDFDKDKSMANLLDPKAMETVRLKYTAGSTYGKVRTVLQQVRPY